PAGSADGVGAEQVFLFGWVNPDRLKPVLDMCIPCLVGGHVPTAAGFRVFKARQAFVRLVIVFGDGLFDRSDEVCPTGKPTSPAELPDLGASFLVNGLLGFLVHVAANV